MKNLQAFGWLVLLVVPPILVLKLVESLPPTVVAVVLLVASPFMGLIAMGIFFWLRWRKQKRRQQTTN